MSTDRTRSTRLLRTLASIGVVTLIAVGCGDDDASTEAMSEDEFCEQLAVLEAGGDDLDYGALARQAPNAEVRDALERIGELDRRFGELDPEDPDAAQEMMTELLTPETDRALQTLEDHLVEECGRELTYNPDN